MDCILDDDEEEFESKCEDDLGLDPDPVSGCHVGKVELVRKRVTRDGRVKLKMSLLGVAVEKCAICMSQFKDGDGAILGATCKHACVSVTFFLWGGVSFRFLSLFSFLPLIY